ncbi:MAG: metallophosphoesterase [Candidatus Omnitrophica bacterium]|nr:metallophosphoesterase [Candidatus Omnitrophota bacterium]
MWLITAAAAGAGLFLYSWFIEPRWRRIFHRSISLGKHDLQPLKILHLSDFHFYRGADERKRFLQGLSGRELDFIFITGDFIDNDSGIDVCIEALRPLKARYGIYAVLGNHDYVHISWRSWFHRTGTLVYDLCHEFNDVERLAGELKKIGIRILRNERDVVEVDGVPITIAGVDDPYTQHDDIPQTFDGYTKDGPCFVLIHTPDRYRELAERHVDMVFSGHTHGGQICLPFWGPIITRSLAPRRMAYGLNDLNGTKYYTTRGVGSSRWTRPRFLCRPEINYFEFLFGKDWKSSPEFEQNQGYN